LADLVQPVYYIYQPSRLRLLLVYPEHIVQEFRRLPGRVFRVVYVQRYRRQGQSFYTEVSGVREYEARLVLKVVQPVREHVVYVIRPYGHVVPPFVKAHVPHRQLVQGADERRLAHPALHPDKQRPFAGLI